MLTSPPSRNTTSPTTPPHVIHAGAVIRQLVRSAQQEGQRVAVVPTMGALHEGHLSLVDHARAVCDLVVTTIFVNPTQFAPGEDLDRYPRDLPRDVALLAERGCQMIFAPEVAEVYPAGSETMIDVGSVADPWEGEVRPTHFAGVATVVMKLLHLVPADVMVLGEKDYQQTLVLKRLVHDLCVGVDIDVAPTIREPDGLAMSSRNAYLSPDERARATALSASLELGRTLIAGGERDAAQVSTQMQKLLHQRGVTEIDYVALVRDGTIEQVATCDHPTRGLIAARVGATRLIDNGLLTNS